MSGSWDGSGATAPPATTAPAWTPAPAPASAPVQARAPQAGPWPLGPLTVPVVLLLATIATGVVSAVVLSELPWAERFDLAGLFTFAFVFGMALTAPLVLLSFTTSARPSVGRALLGTFGTAVGFALVAVVADAATESIDVLDPRLPPRDVLTDEPLSVALIPYQLMLRTFVDFDLLQVDLFGTPIFLTAAIAFGLMMGLVGLGATFASGGRLLSAVLAAVGAAGGAFVGEVFVQYGSLEWPRSFFDQQGPTLLVLIPILLSGVGLGLGALLGRGRATPAAGTPGSFAGYPAPPEVGPTPQGWPPAPGTETAPPPTQGPPPGATTF